jgi:hypothetical protein
MTAERRWEISRKYELSPKGKKNRRRYKEYLKVRRRKNKKESSFDRALWQREYWQNVTKLNLICKKVLKKRFNWATETVKAGRILDGK